MNAAQKTPPQIVLPTIKELGLDLLELSVFQKLWTILKPLVFAGLFFALATWEYWVLSILCAMLVVFHTYVSSSHDLVHNTLHLPKKWNEVLLMLLELVALRSGHAFKVSHLNHHRYFPDRKDIEGESIYKGLLGTLLSGPGYTLRLYAWAIREARPKARQWIVGEGIAIGLIVGMSVLLFSSYPALLLYVVLLYMGSWTYPLATVYIPHVLNFDHPLYQTRKFRGPILSFLFMQHNYHLEHHLYPTVPHQNWRKLAQRLEPFLSQYDLESIRF